MHVYSIDKSPISAVQVILSALAALFIEALTLQAPAPTESIISPNRPTRVAFSLSDEFIAGVLSSFSIISCHAIDICCFLN